MIDRLAALPVAPSNTLPTIERALSVIKHGAYWDGFNGPTGVTKDECIEMAHEALIAARAALAALPVAHDPESGAELIAVERQRQVEVEGWTPEHDDEHRDRSLVWAATCYAQEAAGSSYAGDLWPWDDDSWKPSDDPIRNLVKAGALIAAEIDRLNRPLPDPIPKATDA